MRGQISLEYLFISVISLCLISISLFSLMAIRDFSMKAIEILTFKFSVSTLSNMIGEVCVMGNGNSQYLYLNNLSVESVKDDFWIVRFSSGNMSIVKKALCQVEGKANGETQIKNENGIIILSN
ncbi:MAG: hypothetical protein ABH842_05120 [Candidatus Micrarchaeota archaeon]